jgi:hypothetical protein
VFADLRAALNAAVPGEIALNPCDGVILPRARMVRPLPWTAEREAAFRAAQDKRMAAASVDHPPTTVERQAIWADAALRPPAVMVWMPGHAGRSLIPSKVSDSQRCSAWSPTAGFGVAKCSPSRGPR